MIGLGISLYFACLPLWLTSFGNPRVCLDPTCSFLENAFVEVVGQLAMSSFRNQ